MITDLSVPQEVTIKYCVNKEEMLFPVPPLYCVTSDLHPECVFWPQNRLEHQAGVRSLGKQGEGRQDSLVACCWNILLVLASKGIG